MGSIQMSVEQIPGAEAPNLDSSRGNSQGVRAWGERVKEGLGGVQELNQLAAPSFRAEQEWEGGGLGAEGSKALVVKEGAVGDHMLDGVLY